MKRVLILVPLLILFSTLSYGYIYADYSCLFFNHCIDDGSNEKTTQSLGQMISEAGVFFLKASRDYQDFLQYLEESEYQPVDNSILINTLDNAYENMKAAHTRYHEIWQMSKILDFNPMVLELLLRFDYKSFQKKKNLIPNVFDTVEKFLKKGDLSGIYEKTYIDTGVFLRKIDLLKTFHLGHSINLPLCWEINQRILKSQLFGQYISQIFAEINSNF